MSESPRTCIYCLEQKPAAQFDTEHVVGQAFARFQDNLVLDCVCRACNGLFGRELDEKLAVDSPEGLDRYRHGLKSTADYRSLGRRTTHQVRVTADGPLKGALARHVPNPGGGRQLALEVLPQIGFAPTPDGPFDWYPIAAIPKKSDLGYPKGSTFSIQIQGIEMGAAQAALAAAGYPTGPIEPVKPAETVQAQTTFVIDDVQYRAISKVAFNYLAFVAGAAIARMPQFNEARRYIRYASDPGRNIVRQVADSPVTVSDGPEGRDVPGHFITLRHEADIVAEVSLFSSLLYVVALSVGDFAIGRLPASAHFFDLEKRRVVALPLVVVRRPKPE